MRAVWPAACPGRARRRFRGQRKSEETWTARREAAAAAAMACPAGRPAPRVGGGLGRLAVRVSGMETLKGHQGR